MTLANIDTWLQSLNANERAILLGCGAISVLALVLTDFFYGWGE